MQKPILGLLLGDPAGVGPEIIAKLIVNGFTANLCNPVYIGDKRILERAFGIIGKSAPINVISKVSEADFKSGAVQLIDLNDADPAKCPVGQVSVEGGKACLDELKLAAQLCNSREIEGFCFAPLNKAGMKEAGLNYESEHHYLAHVFGLAGPFGEINVVGQVWTTRTTSHIPIKEVSQNLTVDKIYRAIVLCHTTLKNSGIENPRIAVAALNPHCGENGLCGREEIDVIKPAIEKACAEGRDCSGPYSSDILFIKAFRGDFDGVVTMYHDQGQIALKLRGFDEGITIGGGQPYPIVTCGHGTAYDISGKNIVKTGSFENAVRMAARMANHMAGRSWTTEKKGVFTVISDHLPQIIPICTSVIAIIWMILGLRQYGFWDEFKGPKTGFFPTIIAIVMLAISIFALATSGKVKKPEFDKDNWMAALGMLAMVGASYLIGMELSILVFLILWLRVYEKCTWKSTIIATAVVMLIVIGAFRLWLGIKFPLGLFELIY